jgi:hypothetical protein
MKKLVLAAFALTTAASVFAQGTIGFNNNIGGLRTRVYAPLATATGFSQIGLGSVDTPSGSTSWAGFSGIGSASTAGNLNGQYGSAQTLAQLLGNVGLGDDQSTLRPGSTTMTFRTGAGGGLLGAASTPSFTLIPKDYAFGMTLEMVAWDTTVTGTGDDLSTWGFSGSGNAYDAWRAGKIAAGVSGTFNMTATAGGTGTPPNMPTDGSVKSFNLYIVPEPSTFALAGLGAAAMLIFRRRK